MAKQRLTENFSKDWEVPLNITKLPLQESFKLVEAEGKQYPILEKWEVPVWRLGKKNLNGRTYNESLGRKIEKECKEVVTANLADHPAEDGSVKDIYSVAKNPHVRDGILYVDAYIVDETFEKKLNKMVEAGYGLGVSSSVLGELDENNIVIDESVELERYFDWVNSPSYEVYVTKESKVESVEKQQESAIKNITIENKETVIMSDKLKELTEKNMRLNLDRILEDAENKNTIAAKISSFEEALTYTSDEFLPDVKDKIAQRLSVLKTESLDLAEKGLTVSKLEEDIKTKENEKVSIQEQFDSISKENVSLKEKLDLASKLLDETKEFANKAESLLEISQAEKGSCFSAQEYLTLVEYTEKLEKENESLLKELESAKTSLSSIKEKASAEIKKLTEENSKLAEEVSNYEKEVEDGLMNEEDEIPFDDSEYFPEEGEDFDYTDYGQGVMDDTNELELDIYNDDEVTDYYESLVSEDHRYKTIKEDILKCKTIVEAQRTALRLKGLVEKQGGKKAYAPSIHSDIRMTEKAYEVDAAKLLPKGWK